MQNIEFGTQDPDHVMLKFGRRRFNEELKLSLEDLWWRTIEAAKLFPADDEARQWRLVAWIAGAKARGDVPSLQEDPYAADGGKTLWKDLPFFQGALERAWADRSKLSISEWHNLNAFVARLVAVTGMDLIHLGLETIREALEVELPIFSTGEDQLTARSVSELLPAAICWFKFPSVLLRVMIHATGRAATEWKECVSRRASTSWWSFQRRFESCKTTVLETAAGRDWA